MKHFKIVHKATGLTLRQYVKKYSVKPINEKYSYIPDDFRYKTIHYVIGEKGTPGLYYHLQYEGTALLWLDHREFEIVLHPQPIPQTQGDRDAPIK